MVLSARTCSTFAGLVLLAILFAAAATPASAACTEYGTPGCPYPSFGDSDTFRPDTDRPGSDYTSFDLQGNYPSDCRDACLNDARCRAWTFVKRGVQGPNARCWLKSAIPEEQANSCCVSGRNPNVVPRAIKKLGKAKVGLPADASVILNAHNGYRAKHCVPNLTWSSQLAASAQQWANQCTPNGRGGFAHSGTAWASASGYGENLAWGGSLSGSSAVDLWYGEINSYDFDAPSWNGGVGHFTQVVWRNTTEVGCAVASCSGQNLWVCQYSPTGNWNVDQPGELANNVPPVCQ